MNIRLISGVYGGRVIEGSGTDRTHPMSERVRNSMFNIIGDEISGARVLDAFAGSGSLAFESLSRGADSAVLVERDRIAQKVIDANITTLKIDKKKAKLIKAPLASWLRTSDQEGFDIIFVDPPYHDMQFSTVAKLSGLLKPNGLMVLSYADNTEVPTELGVVVVDNRSYGNAALAFCRKKDA